jgi:hypothetical protein
MPQRKTLRQLAEAAELLRAYFQEDVVQIEYRKASGRGVLTQLRFAVGENGRRTKKTIECLADGKKRYFDRNYDVEITAVTVNGKRADV